MSDNAESVEVVETVEPVEEVAAPEAEEIEVAPAPKVEEEDAPIPKGVQKRIDRAVRQKYEAEAESKYLREQVARLQEQPKPKPQQQVEPKLEDFQDYETYLKAAAKHEARQELQQQMTQHTQRVEQERAQAAQRQSAESWQQKVSSATAEMPDFADVVGSSNIPMPDHVKAVILQSEQGPKLAYYLASHPAEAEQIASQHPLAAIRSLVRIEDKIAAIPKVSKAPDPIKPLGSGRVAESGLSDSISADEWLRRRNKQLQQR